MRLNPGTNKTKKRNKQERIKRQGDTSIDGGSQLNGSNRLEQFPSPSLKPNTETFPPEQDDTPVSENEDKVTARRFCDVALVQPPQKKPLGSESLPLTQTDEPTLASPSIPHGYVQSSKNGEKHANDEGSPPARKGDLVERSLTTLEAEPQGGSLKEFEGLSKANSADANTTRLKDNEVERKYNASSIFKLDLSSINQPPEIISVSNTFRGGDSDVNDSKELTSSSSPDVSTASKPALVLDNSSGTAHHSSATDKKQARLLDAADELNETTPLIRPAQSTLEPSLERRASSSNTCLPRTVVSQRVNYAKLPLWVWLLVAGLLLLVNVTSLVYLFSQPEGHGRALERLLLQMDLKQLQVDLENLQPVSRSGAETDSDWVSEKSLINANYIQEQLTLLSNFDVDVQRFLTPRWSLSDVPYMAFHFGLRFPLVYRQDFVVLPFSGEASDLRLPTTSPTLESCSLYNHHVRGRAVVIPYPNPKLSGISTPCSVWSLVYSAQEAGAAAVVFYLQSIDAEFPKFEGSPPLLLPKGWRPGDRTLEIPVVLLNHVFGELLRSVPFSVDLKASVSFSLRLSKNIIAKLNSPHRPPRLNPAHQPVLIGAHWDSDPMTFNGSHFRVTGAAGLLAAARAIDAAHFRFGNHPIKLVWFGARSPLKLGLVKYLDYLNETSIHPYFYFDLGRLEGERPGQFDIKEIPPTLRQVSVKAQRAMNATLRYGFDHPSKHPSLDPLLYRYDGTLGVPEMAFVEYGVPAAGIASFQLANSTNSQVEMVLQLTKVALIAIDAIST